MHSAERPTSQLSPLSDAQMKSVTQALYPSKTCEAIEDMLEPEIINVQNLEAVKTRGIVSERPDDHGPDASEP